MWKIMLAGLLLLCLMTDSCRLVPPPPPPPSPKTKVVIIFCDVTNSLIPKENEKVAQLANSVIDSLPVGTQYVVYPILLETQLAYPIVEAEVTWPDGDIAVERANKKKRNEGLASDIKKLYETTNSKRGTDNRSCILNTLPVAQSYFMQYPEEVKFDYELVFISDMIEECDATPLRHTVNLDKSDISKEIALAENFPPGIDLSRVHIDVIFPSTAETMGNRHKANVEDLQRFWFAVFKKAGLKDETYRSSRQLYWTPGRLPAHFTAPQNDAAAADISNGITRRFRCKDWFEPKKVVRATRV
jgi:hypothetical protein